MRALAAQLSRLAIGLVVLALLAPQARPTWSIVVVDTRTGEMAVAGATCVAGIDLKRYLAVVYDDVGVAAAQSAVDVGAINRQLIWDGFMQGLAPAEILQLLALSDPQHAVRQYGIVDLRHDPVTFTGSACGQAASGAAGIVGDLRYAVQGNVLTGDRVVQAAEQALLETPGDLSQRIMAAMEAARSLGGDGRCSCSGGNPTGCGVPPPAFVKSAHVSFFVLARRGGRRGECSGPTGCANGSYFLDLKFTAGALGPEPVISLQRLYDVWRVSKARRPDQVRSRVTALAQRLPADGTSAARVEVELYDIDGKPVAPAGGLDLWLVAAGQGGPFTTPSPITHLGGNRYGFALKAGTTPGMDHWQVWVDDGEGPVLLQPEVEIRVGP